MPMSISSHKGDDDHIGFFSLVIIDCRHTHRRGALARFLSYMQVLQGSGNSRILRRFSCEFVFISFVGKRIREGSDISKVPPHCPQQQHKLPQIRRENNQLTRIVALQEEIAADLDNQLCLAQVRLGLGVVVIGTIFHIAMVQEE